ncbi:MAG: hypothetical protein HQM04_15690 [Magnetococcales bacterium]|nr:hypothetical protein [Magnetococcales bacterium]MBF0116470.1 hypothetical protein [Magnetococcales bacterium]
MLRRSMTGEKVRRAKTCSTILVLKGALRKIAALWGGFFVRKNANVSKG